MTATLINVTEGLRNVAVTNTTIGDVRGDAGFYHYRQYSAVELAEQCSLEEVWYLLFFGHLPNASELQAFEARVAEARSLPASVLALLPSVVANQAPDAGALDGLRTGLSMLASARGMQPWLDLDEQTRCDNALTLCAGVPTLLAALHQLQQGRQPVPPDPSLGFAANYLLMSKGAPASDEEVRAIEHYLISTIDHGFNASTFTGRVVAGTGADLGACLVAAVGALSGPLHGGAPSRALEALDEIGTPERARAWVAEQLQAGRKLMGFGHAVYRTEDPRSAMLKRIAIELGGAQVDLAIAVESEIVSALADLKPGRQIHTNVEFFAGIVMQRCGLPPQMFTPTFAASRVIGWSANILEQAAENKIIRPAARYVGPVAPQQIPSFEERMATCQPDERLEQAVVRS